MDSSDNWLPFLIQRLTHLSVLYKYIQKEWITKGGPGIRTSNEYIGIIKSIRNSRKWHLSVWVWHLKKIMTIVVNLTSCNVHLTVFFQVVTSHARNAGPVNAVTNAAKTGNGNTKLSKWMGSLIFRRRINSLYLSKVIITRSYLLCTVCVFEWWNIKVENSNL